MDLHLHLSDAGGLAEQIYSQLSERIATGALPARTVLPSSRELAGRLSVSRATVVTAYERLAAHGSQHWETDHLVTRIQGEVCRPDD